MDEVLRGWRPAAVADQVAATPRHNVPAAARDGRGARSDTRLFTRDVRLAGVFVRSVRAVRVKSRVDHEENGRWAAPAHRGAVGRRALGPTRVGAGTRDDAGARTRTGART